MTPRKLQYLAEVQREEAGLPPLTANQPNPTNDVIAFDVPPAISRLRCAYVIDYEYGNINDRQFETLKIEAANILDAIRKGDERGFHFWWIRNIKEEHGEYEY